MLLPSSGWRPGLRLNTLRHRTAPAQRASPAKVERISARGGSVFCFQGPPEPSSAQRVYKGLAQLEIISATRLQKKNSVWDAVQGGARAKNELIDYFST